MPSSYNDISSIWVSSIAFSGQAAEITLSGSKIIGTGTGATSFGISQWADASAASRTQEIALDIALDKNMFVYPKSNGSIMLFGVISKNGTGTSSVYITDNGIVSPGGTVPNTYRGITYVRYGTLKLAGSSGDVIPGALQLIPSGSGNTYATVDLAGTQETVSSLVFGADNQGEAKNYRDLDDEPHRLPRWWRADLGRQRYLLFGHIGS